MIKTGQTVKFLKGAGSPLNNSTLPQVLAALTCGQKYSSGKPLLDTVEMVDGELRREHTWTFDGESTAEFRPDFVAEKIDFNELCRRFLDLDWCKANPHHPISYLRYFVDNRSDMVAFLKNHKPMEKITRGVAGSRSICLIPSDATDEVRAAALKEFNQS